MTLNELPKATLRAEVEFVKAMLSTGNKHEWANNEHICKLIKPVQRCEKCPITSYCNPICLSEEWQGYAQEYAAALEASLKEGASNA